MSTYMYVGVASLSGCVVYRECMNAAYTHAASAERAR